MGHRTACAGFLSALADLGPPSTALVGVGTAGRREASASERADVWTRTYVGDGARRIFPADRGGLTHLDREPWPPVGRLVEYVPRVGQHVDDHCLRLPRSGLLRLVSRDRGRRCPGIPVGSTASHARRCRIGGAQGRLPVRAQPSSRFRARGCTCAGSSAGIRTGARRASSTGCMRLSRSTFSRRSSWVNAMGRAACAPCVRASGDDPRGPALGPPAGRTCAGRET
jgi:hypothetical protein